MKRRAVLLTVAFLMAIPAEAGWYQGVAAFKGGNYPEALREFKELTRSDPDFYGGHFMLGNTFLKLNEPAQAEMAFRRANSLKPGSPPIILALGRTYMLLGEHSKTLSIFKEVNPSAIPAEQQALFYHLRGVTYQKDGRIELALEDLGKALSLAANDAGVHHAYGVALVAAGQRAKGVEHVQRAVSLDPDDEKKAETLAKLQQPDETERFLPLGDDYVEGSCLKEVFNRFCLGGEPESLPEPLSTAEQQGLKKYGYSHADQIEIVGVRDGKIVMVRRNYSPASWIHWDDLVAKLDEVYGAGTDLSSFPDYADDRDARGTAIRIEEGRARRVWPAPGYNVELVWFGDDLYLDYRTPETQELENPEGF